MSSSQNVNPASTSEQSEKAHNQNLSSKMDQHSVTRRLQKELMELMTSADKGISAFPDGDNLFRWVGTIEGGTGTAYDGLMYKLVLDFPANYPYNGPSVKFQTPCYHPNVDQHGNICLDILKEKWSALYDVRTVLLSIQSLLAEPNNDSPLNVQAAELWKNQTVYKAVVAEKYKNDNANVDTEEQ